MQEFVDRQVPAVNRDPLMTAIRSVYNLLDLARRPYLLRLICESSEYLRRPAESARSMTAGVLYEAYISAWIRRELRAGRTTVDPTALLRILEDLAFDLAANDRRVIAAPALFEWLSKKIADSGTRDVVVRQLLTSTFLQRSSTDQWDFGHRSIQEYLYARRFFRWEDEGATGDHPVTHIPVWRFVADLALSRFSLEKASKWITETTPRDEDPTLTRTTLRAAAAYWFVKSSPNALRMLPLRRIMLDSVDLRGADFSHCVLSGADLHQSDLEESNLDYADLTGADLSLCNLRNVSCRGTILTGACVAGAECAGTDLTLAVGHASLRRILHLRI